MPAAHARATSSCGLQRPSDAVVCMCKSITWAPTLGERSIHVVQDRPPSSTSASRYQLRRRDGSAQRINRCRLVSWRGRRPTTGYRTVHVDNSEVFVRPPNAPTVFTHQSIAHFCPTSFQGRYSTMNWEAWAAFAIIAVALYALVQNLAGADVVMMGAAALHEAAAEQP